MNTIFTICALIIKQAVISPAMVASKFRIAYRNGRFTIPPLINYTTNIPPKAPKLAIPITGTINI